MSTGQSNSFLRNITTSDALVDPTSKMKFSCLGIENFQNLDKLLEAGIFLQVGVLQCFPDHF